MAHQPVPAGVSASRIEVRARGVVTWRLAGHGRWEPGEAVLPPDLPRPFGAGGPSPTVASLSRTPADEVVLTLRFRETPFVVTVTLAAVGDQAQVDTVVNVSFGPHELGTIAGTLDD